MSNYNSNYNPNQQPNYGAPQQQGYGAPQYYQNYSNPAPMYNPVAAPQMSVGAWVGTLLLCCIPIVNIVLMFIWAFGDNPERAARKNWARATLLLAAISIALTILLTLVLGASLSSLMYNLM